MKKRLMRWAILLIIGLGIGAGIAYVQKQNEMSSGIASNESGPVTMIKRNSSTSNTNSSVQVGGAFTLLNQDGETVTEQDFLETHKLVFFGFTYCPAVCPTELQKVAVIMNELGADADKFTPMFISVDPERDTPDVIKQYVEQFHPKLIGLTGSLEQVEAVKDTFKVYSAKVENEMMDEYMVDHSAFLYLLDKDSKMIGMYPSKDTPAEIVADILSRSL